MARARPHGSGSKNSLSIAKNAGVELLPVHGSIADMPDERSVFGPSQASNPFRSKFWRAQLTKARATASRVRPFSHSSTYSWNSLERLFGSECAPAGAHAPQIIQIGPVADSLEIGNGMSLAEERSC